MAGLGAIGIILLVIVAIIVCIGAIVGTIAFVIFILFLIKKNFDYIRRQTEAEIYEIDNWDPEIHPAPVREPPTNVYTSAQSTYSYQSDQTVQPPYMTVPQPSTDTSNFEIGNDLVVPPPNTSYL